MIGLLTQTHVAGAMHVDYYNAKVTYLIKSYITDSYGYDIVPTLIAIEQANLSNNNMTWAYTVCVIISQSLLNYVVN